MDAEESIRGNPIDGVVLLTGCDKTTPSTVMGAASVGLAHHCCSGRADAEWKIQRPGYWFRYACMEV